MTAGPVDLGRVRHALAGLDRVTTEHPDLTSAEARQRLDAWIEGEEKGEQENTGQQAGEETT